MDIETNKVGREIMRLLKISRETAEQSLLDEALAGRERTVDTVSRLMRFVTTNFGQDGSEVTDKFWKVCGPFLSEAGVQEKDLQKIRVPHPRSGDRGFKSVLEEF